MNIGMLHYLTLIALSEKTLTIYTYLARAYSIGTNTERQSNCPFTDQVK